MAPSFINTGVKFYFEKNFKPQYLETFQATENDWNDWGWQLRKSFKNEKDFSQFFKLSDSEKAAFQNSKEIFNIRSTPYYAALAGQSIHDPIRRILMPYE